MFASAALLALLVVVPQPAGGAAPPIDRFAFIAELERAAAAVNTAGSRDDLIAAAGAIPKEWRVRVDGVEVAIDVTWIHREIASSDAQSWGGARRRAAAHLAALREQAMEAPPARSADPGAALTRILSTREFQRAQRTRWLDQLRERITRWLLDLLTKVFGPAIGSRTVAIVFAWIAGAIALIALSMWLASLLTRRSRATALELPPVASRAAARDWALRALAAARRGDLREAVRCGYNAALCRLEDQGVWTVDDARTPREYARLLPPADPRQSTFGDLTRRFEHVWYGGRAATDDDARHVAAHLERLGCVRPGDQTI